MGFLLGKSYGSKYFFKLTYIPEQHLFSMPPLILTFAFGTIQGSFSDFFFCPNKLLGG